MAEKRSTLAKSIHDELICAVCLDRFKSPKMLPCLHSFCADCLQDLVIRSPKKGHVSCPECRVQHAVPSKGFTNHFLLGKLVEHLTFHEADKEEGESKKSVCGSGLDSNAAAGWCVDCHSYLCLQCMDLHKQLKIIRSHKTLTLAEVKEGALTQVQQKYMCSEHEGEELKLYCKTCREVICRDCAIVTHQVHKYVFIKDAKEEIVQELQELMVQVEEKDREFQGYITEVDTVMTAKKYNFAGCEEQVNEYFDEYIQKIQRHRASLLDKLYHDQVNEEKVLVTEKEDLEFTKARFVSGITFAKQLLSSGSATDITLLSKQASKQLKSLASMKRTLHEGEKFWIFRRKIQPMDCDVQVVLLPAFGDRVKSIPHGLNELSIHTSVRPDVNITTDSGQPCKVTEIASTAPSSWRVTYIIPAPPFTRRVHIAAQSLGIAISTQIACFNQLTVGTRVSRGPDWCDGNQDGGPGSIGTVTSFTFHNYLLCKVDVKWKETGTYRYKFAEFHGSECSFYIQTVE